MVLRAWGLGKSSEGDSLLVKILWKEGKNHEIVTISEEEFRAAEDEKPIEKYQDWQQGNIRTAEKILYGDDWIPLPSEFDISMVLIKIGIITGKKH